MKDEKKIAYEISKEFSIWLARTQSVNKFLDYYAAIVEADTFLQEHNILKRSLFLMDKADAISWLNSLPRNRIYTDKSKTTLRTFYLAVKLFGEFKEERDKEETSKLHDSLTRPSGKKNDAPVRPIQPTKVEKAPVLSPVNKRVAESSKAPASEDKTAVLRTPKKPEFVFTSTDLISAVKANNIRYADHRYVDGALWLIGGHELDSFIALAKEKGYTFIFEPDGSRNSNWMPCWWYKPEKQTSIPSKEPTVYFDGILNDEKYDPLRNALVKEGYTKLEELWKINLWTFMNSHRLYTIQTRLAISNELHDKLHLQGAVPDAVANCTIKAFDTEFKGATPSEAFAAVMAFLATKYPLKFQLICGIGNPHTMKVVLHRYDVKGNKIKLQNPEAYIDRDLTKEQVKEYVNWAITKCTGTIKPFTVIYTEPVQENMILTVQTNESLHPDVAGQVLAITQSESLDPPTFPATSPSMSTTSQVSQIEKKGTTETINIREQFCQWLSLNPQKRFKTEQIIRAFDDASGYCCSHGISKISLWDINDKNKFSSVMTRLLEMKLFRILYKDSASVLDRAVPIYKKFLTQRGSIFVTDKQQSSVIPQIEVNPTNDDAEINTEKQQCDSDNSILLADENIVMGGFAHNIPEEANINAPVRTEWSETERTMIYQKLFAISKVYDDPNGITISKINTLLGKETDELLIRNILDGVAWAVKLSENVYSFSPKAQAVVKEPITSFNVTPQDIVTITRFYRYLKENAKMAESSCHVYIASIKAAEKYAGDNHFVPNKLFGCPAEESIALMRKLMSNDTFVEYDRSKCYRHRSAFIKLSKMLGQPLSVTSGSSSKTDTISRDFDKDRFVETLLRRYRNGMQFDSIDFENFRDMYDMLYDEELSFDDAALEERLRLCGVVYKDRLFPAEGIIDNDTKEKLFTYIDNCFSSGKKVIYYKAIFEDLADVFASCFTLSDKDMLKAYIEYAAEPGKYYFFQDYISIERNVEINHNTEVANYFLTCGKPVSTDQVCLALSHIPQDQVRTIIVTDSHFLRNSRGEYYHKDIFEIDDDELEKISGIIGGFINENGYAIWTDVWNSIKETMPVFLENNLYLSWLGIRNALEQQLIGKYNFEAAVISPPEDHFSMRDVYQLYAKHHSEFTIEDIYSLSKRLDTVIYFDALYEVSVRVSYSLFISKNKMTFNIQATDKAIHSFVAKEYIRIREIDSFLAFPNVGYEWNEYLLESYVTSYSKEFMLLNNGYAMNNVAGAIVSRKGKIQEFVDACAAVIADSEVPLKKTDVLNYLVDAKMITRRSYREVDSAIAKASRIRGKKE